MTPCPTEIRFDDDGACYVVQVDGQTLELDLLASVERDGVSYFVLRPWSQRHDDQDEYDIYVFSAHDVEDVDTVQLGVVEDDALVEQIIEAVFPDDDDEGQA
jgi:uncharacterized protein YrzB (UPF0473 family)